MKKDLEGAVLTEDQLLTSFRLGVVVGGKVQLINGSINNQLLFSVLGVVLALKHVDE